MVKLVKKPVTLDHLAQMVEKGLRDVGKLAKATKLGFDEIHQTLELKVVKDKEEFEKIDDRFDGVNQKLSNLDNRLDTFVTHEKRLVKVERELGFAV